LGDISASYGDEVTLWGDGLPVEEVAEKSGMVPYELLCRVKMRAKYLESS
jgi:alanine racemase